MTRSFVFLPLALLLVVVQVAHSQGIPYYTATGDTKIIDGSFETLVANGTIDYTGQNTSITHWMFYNAGISNNENRTEHIPDASYANGVNYAVRDGSSQFAYLTGLPSFFTQNISLNASTTYLLSWWDASLKWRGGNYRVLVQKALDEGKDVRSFSGKRDANNIEEIDSSDLFVESTPTDENGYGPNRPVHLFKELVAGTTINVDRGQYWTQKVLAFEVPQDGLYSLTFDNVDDEDLERIYIDDISIEKLSCSSELPASFGDWFIGTGASVQGSDVRLLPAGLFGVCLTLDAGLIDLSYSRKVVSNSGVENSNEVVTFVASPAYGGFIDEEGHVGSDRGLNNGGTDYERAGSEAHQVFELFTTGNYFVYFSLNLTRNVTDNTTFVFNSFDTNTFASKIRPNNDFYAYDESDWSTVIVVPSGEGQINNIIDFPSGDYVVQIVWGSHLFKTLPSLSIDSVHNVLNLVFEFDPFAEGTAIIKIVRVYDSNELPEGYDGYTGELVLALSTCASEAGSIAQPFKNICVRDNAHVIDFHFDHRTVPYRVQDELKPGDYFSDYSQLDCRCNLKEVRALNSFAPYSAPV